MPASSPLFQEFLEHHKVGPPRDKDWCDQSGAADVPLTPDGYCEMCLHTQFGEEDDARDAAANILRGAVIRALYAGVPLNAIKAVVDEAIDGHASGKELLH
jgi:hypothetical protein